MSTNFTLLLENNYNNNDNSNSNNTSLTAIFQGNPLSLYQNVSILDFIEARMMDWTWWRELKL